MTDRDTVAFRKRGLVPFAFAALLTVALGATVLVVDATVLVVDHETAGTVLPRWAAVILAAVVLALGVWLAYCAAERAASDDPAVQIREDELHLHVNPGRRLSLRRDQVGGIDGPDPSRSRLVVGRRQLTVRTNLPPGWFSRDIVVGERLLDAHIGDVADMLRRWHRPDTGK